MAILSGRGLNISHRGFIHLLLLSLSMIIACPDQFLVVIMLLDGLIHSVEESRYCSNSKSSTRILFP